MNQINKIILFETKNTGIAKLNDYLEGLDGAYFGS